MTWNSVMGLISSIALFLPICLMLAIRLVTYSSFPALLIYFIFVLFFNLLNQGYIKADTELVNSWGLINNFVDPILMISFLTYFSTSAGFTRNIKKVILGFVALDLIMLLLFGFTLKAVTIPLGVGLVVVFCLCLFFFIRQAKIAILHRKAAGKALMVASLLFAYGCFTIIYLMFYVFKTPYVDDTLLVYYMVTTFSSLLIGAGIIIESKRVQKLNELKLTRKELSIIYKDAEPAPPLKGAVLDFDKEQWN